VSSETLLVGAITFICGLDEDEVRSITDDLSECTEISPEDMISDRTYQDSGMQWKSLLTYSDYGKRQYTLHYNYVNWSSHTYENRWNDMMKYLAKHAKKIREVNLSLFYLQEPDRDIYVDLKGLMELRIEQVSKQLLGEYEDE
jgi:hypothetical protein